MRAYSVILISLLVALLGCKSKLTAISEESMAFINSIKEQKDSLNPIWGPLGVRTYKDLSKLKIGSSTPVISIDFEKLTKMSLGDLNNSLDSSNAQTYLVTYLVDNTRVSSWQFATETTFFGTSVRGPISGGTCEVLFPRHPNVDTRIQNGIVRLPQGMEPWLMFLISDKWQEYFRVFDYKETRYVMPSKDFVQTGKGFVLKENIAYRLSDFQNALKIYKVSAKQ